MSIVLVIAVNWFLFRSRAGLKISRHRRQSRFAMLWGISVIRTRYLAVMFGGACAPVWQVAQLFADLHAAMDGKHVGRRGWIALRRVVFSSWRPWRILAGGYLFGAGDDPAVARAGSSASAFRRQFLSMLPYARTYRAYHHFSQSAPYDLDQYGRHRSANHLCRTVETIRKRQPSERQPKGITMKN